MKVTPRAPEVKEIVALLERDDYDSASALAKDIIKKVGELFGQRELYAWVWKESDPDSQLAWGVFSSESEALRRVKPVSGALKGHHMILPLGPIDSLEQVFELGKPLTDPRCMCRHTEIVHQHPHKNGRCVVRGCDCKKFNLNPV